MSRASAQCRASESLTMNPKLVRALIGFGPVSAFLAYSIAVLVRHRTVPAGLQLAGALCLVVVVLTHMAEALHVFPAMRWGGRDSPGHYVDLSSAVLGTAFVVIGYFLRRRNL
jgi:hypothetical protein